MITNQEARTLIKSLVDVEDSSIEIKNDGFLSRGFVTDNGRIIFKFPRNTDVTYENEISILNFLNELNLGINLQKVGWTSNDNSYLGLYGVVGKSIENQQLTAAQKKNIGNQLGSFLKKLHSANREGVVRTSLAEEISAWQNRYTSVKNYISEKFTTDEQTVLDTLMMDYMPKVLLQLGENLVFSHGDLGEGNVFVDENDKVGVIDFNSSGYFEEAADFMDISDEEIRKAMLDSYGASDDLRKKVELRKDIRPLIVLKPYLERGDEAAITVVVSKIRETLAKYTGNSLLQGNPESPLTIAKIAETPSLLTYTFTLKTGTLATLRPLLLTDAKSLANFLSNLSETTQKFYTLDSFDEATAEQLCADINKYDKLRFVAEVNNEIVGLFEFSMDLVQDDIDRYKSYGITLEQGSDCRFGPCIADSIQGTGFASAVFPYIVDIAKKLGQKRMILWGGVFTENDKAIKYYTRNGFKKAGRFKNSDGKDSIDMLYTL